MNHTSEQLAIINSTLNKITVNAGPGMGKSHLLLSIAEHNKKETNQILCFNSMIRRELIEKAKTKHIGNVKIDTFHSLAFNYFNSSNVIHNFYYRKKNLESFDYFSMERILINVGMKHEANEVNYFLEYLNTFFKSDKTLIEFCKENKLKQTEFIKIWNYLLKDSSAPMFHEFYIKCFQLIKPSSYMNKILIDEFQDVSACYLDICNSIGKNSKTVQVGDQFQKIYGYNGALGIDHYDYSLTQSFRFGSSIANMCNFFIKNFIKDSTYEIIGVNKNQVVVDDFDNNENKTIIFRTNASLIERLITETIYENNICLIPESTFENIKHIYNLSLIEDGQSYNYRGVIFGNEELISIYYKKSKDTVLGIYLKLKNSYGKELTDTLEKVIEKITFDKNIANVELVTAHKCKGMQIENVEIADDFPTLDKINEMKQKGKSEYVDEVYILYVAITRCSGKLKLNNDLKGVFKC